MLLLAALLLAAPQIQETIVVQRIVVSLRIVDPGGKPLLGLTPADFTATMQNAPIEVESVSWIPETPGGRDLAGLPQFDQDYLDAIAATPDLQLPDPGRLFVFLFQTDFGRNTVRLRGQMHFLPYAERIVAQLPPEDRVAVLTFDSHLRFRLDFTRDRAAINRAMRESLLIGDMPVPPAVPEPSLGACLDPVAMRRTVVPEQALLILADALAQIPGDKQIVLFGYGLGELVARQLVLRPEWDVARKHLNEAGIIVNTVCTGCSGVLTAGLRKAAAESGGFFFGATDFPSQTVLKFDRGPLAGHYEVELKPPPGIDVGTYDVELRVQDQVFHAQVRLFE